MAKEKFERNKPHVNVGTIGHVDHGKTTLTAALLSVLAAHGQAKKKDYADIAKGGTVRDANKTVTIAVSHVEYESNDRTYASAGTPTWRASRMCSRVCGIGPSAAETTRIAPSIWAAPVIMFLM